MKRILVLPIIILLGVGFGAAGSEGSAELNGLPVFAIAVIVAFAIQVVAFFPAYLMSTEKFYDLTGSITYISTTILIYLTAPNPDLRTNLLAAFVLVWALRLGTFLFRRVLKSGGDDRFDEIKVNPIRFLIAWLIQGLWVAITAGAAWAAMSSSTRMDLGVMGVIGALVWVIGFAIEVVSDRQKSKFKADPANDGKFINVGLWSWSRHPNYFGEIVLWIGIALMAFPVLQGLQYVTLISPLFVTFLLVKVSGIPMLEEKADNRWGGQEDYEEYKESTPVLIPRPPSS